MLIASLALALVIQGTAPPAPQPPADSPPVVRTIEITFPAQGNVSLVDPTTYLYYIQTRPSRASEGVWVPYDEQRAKDDFGRLWATGFLDDLRIDVTDEPYANGVIGKHVTYTLEEKQRIKIVEFGGSKAVDTAAIEERLKAQDAMLRLDTFFDAASLRKVEGLVRALLQEKGFRSAEVTHTITPVPGGPKLAHVIFTLSEGPLVRVESVRFTGAHALSTRTLMRQIKSGGTGSRWLPDFLSRPRPFRAELFAEDAERIVQAYHDRGYVAATVGTPEIRDEARSDDQRTQWVSLTVPIVEGRQHTVSAVGFDGNTVFSAEQLATLFTLRPGEVYNEGRIRKGLEKAREVYGAAGHYEFTAYPDLTPDAAPPPVALAATGHPTVSVVLRIQEGPKYFVHHLSFRGNTVTRDNVIRREVSLLEGGVFSTEALKTSVRRLNQLGYFKPIEDATHVKVDKLPGDGSLVDVTLTVEEQNRNQVNFGAGVSQFEGLFGNITFSTTNFLGRGETLSLSLQAGQRANSRQISFTEPYLFNRPISASADIYSRKYDYLVDNVVGYSEVREGSSWAVGRLLGPFTRAYVGYTYEIVHVSIADGLKTSTSSGAGTPAFDTFADAGRHVDSRVTPSLVFNTVDSPIMPHRGVRVTASTQLAGRFLNGGYDYLKPELEAVWWLPTSRRTGFGLRANGGWLRTFGTTSELPYYFRYFLGGDQQIRGVNIRTVGPVDSSNRALGGNKFVLFNAEYFFDIAGPVRLLLFHDAGQAFSESERVDLRQLRTSSGAELRVFMPVLNVPFRLIWSKNIYRDSFQPAQGFRFSVGTTF